MKCACERLYVLKKDSYGRGRLEDLAPSCDAATTHRTLEEDLLDSGTCGDGIACRRAFRRRLFKSETNTALVCTTTLLRRRHSYIRGTLRRRPQGVSTAGSHRDNSNARARTAYKIVPSGDETVRDLIPILAISWKHQCQLLLGTRLYVLRRVSPVADEPLWAADDGVVRLSNNQRLAVNLAGRVERVVEERPILNKDE